MSKLELEAAEARKEFRKAVSENRDARKCVTLATHALKWVLAPRAGLRRTRVLLAGRTGSGAWVDGAALGARHPLDPGPAVEGAERGGVMTVRLAPVGPTCRCRLANRQTMVNRSASE